MVASTTSTKFYFWNLFGRKFPGHGSMGQSESPAGCFGVVGAAKGAAAPADESDQDLTWHVKAIGCYWSSSLQGRCWLLSFD
jgi:hypothetical protein